MKLTSAFLIPFSLVIALFTASCTTAYKQSIGLNEQRVFTRIYKTDFNLAWQASLDALKDNALDVSNREGGYIQTKWTDNTADKAFNDSYGYADSFMKAQYRFRVTVSKDAAYNGLPATKVSVRKEQLIQHDVLEGWQAVDTDTVEENTLLYRIGRLIFIKMKLAKIEEEKTKQEIDSSKF